MQRLTQILSRPAVWMIAVLLAAFWQVAFCRYTLQWDMTDQAFVWHRFISECFHAKIIPLWAPYSHFGYPIYADPQSGVFYPIVWLVTTVTRYTLYSNNFEYIIHIVLAAFGMRYLLLSLSVSRSTAAVFGLVYAMSGPFVGHASHLMLIGSLCWLPFVLGSYIRFLRDDRLTDMLLMVLFTFLLICGGYSGITITAVYVVAAILAYHILSLIPSGKIPLVKLFRGHMVLSVLILLVSAGFLYAVSTALPYISRGAGISRETAGNVPFTPTSLLTMVYPGSVGSNTIDFGTNSTMVDLYIGIIPLLLLIAAIFVRRTRSTYIILAGSIFFLIASMGAYTPLRGWMYDYMPGMRLFRHAGIFRFFSCIGFIVLAARVFDAWSARGFMSGRVSPSLIRNVLYAIIIADMLISVQLDMHKTVVSDRLVKDIQAHVDTYPRGFPIPENVSLTAYGEWNDSMIAPPIWQNAGFIRKQIAFGGYNGFCLSRYLELSNRPDFFKKIGPEKLVETDEGEAVRIVAFAPGRFSCDIDGAADRKVTLGQMYFPGWTATVDGAEAVLTETSDHFISCAVSSGKHHIEFVFAPRGAKIAFIYTIAIFFLLLMAIAVSRRLS